HEAAFGIGTALTSTMHILISVSLLRRRMQGRIGARAILSSLARTLFAGCLAGLAAYGVILLVGKLDLAHVGRLLARSIRVFLPLGAAMIAFLATAALLRMEELGLLIPERLRARVLRPFGRRH